MFSVEVSVIYCGVMSQLYLEMVVTVKFRIFHSAGSCQWT